MLFNHTIKQIETINNQAMEIISLKLTNVNQNQCKMNNIIDADDASNIGKLLSVILVLIRTHGLPYQLISQITQTQYAGRNFYFDRFRLVTEFQFYVEDIFTIIVITDCFEVQYTVKLSEIPINGNS